MTQNLCFQIVMRLNISHEKAEMKWVCAPLGVKVNVSLRHHISFTVLGEALLIGFFFLSKALSIQCLIHMGVL